MQVLKFNDEQSWLDSRLTRITGTRLIMPRTKDKTKKLDGFYDLIGENLLKNNQDKSSMDIGTELEPESIARFVKETGKQVDTSLMIWTRDDNSKIALSPDGVVIGEEAAVETKSLSAGKHIKTFLTQEIPSCYHYQKLQYFVVNEKLETLYWLFYNPNLIVNDFFYIVVKRSDIQDEIVEYLEFQNSILKDVENIINDLTF